VKSIILLTDLHNPEALLLALFSHSFDIVSGSAKSSSGEEVAANVKFDLTSLLVTVVEEAQSLATAVIDVIIAQFLRVDPRVAESRAVKGKKNEAGTDEKQGTLIPRDYSPAYNMSKTICDSCTDKMAQYISGYFNDVIVDASEGLNGAPKHKPHRRASFDDSDDEGLSGPSGEDLKEISKAHRLVRELWRACPDVLQNVIPQVDAELSAESASLRTIATETIGDVAAGIGIAGPPPPPPMDPAAYPTATLQTSQPSYAQLSVLLTPISPKSFSQTHPTAYASFLSRRHDKSAAVRSAWTTAVGRILITSSGGIGLSEEEEQRLMKALAEMLGDADEHVRSRAVKAVGQFSFSEIILRVGASGGVSTADSVLSVLSERVKDRKHSVREEAMTCLGRIWGVASGELEANTEQVVSIVGDAPTKIFDAYYTNDPDTHSLINSVLFELLLPLSFPPIKSKSAKAVNGNSQVVKDSQAVEDPAKLDVDELRVRRILTLLRRLDESSRKVFYAIQGRQVSLSKYVGALLQQCELYNVSKPPIQYFA
jgi:sister chromatid cohesion protein PDS5